MIIRTFFLIAVTILFAGCKVLISVPEEGGIVITTSGEIDPCEHGQECEVDVVDIFFDQQFEAVPDEGYEFVHWEKAHRTFCGGNTEPCHLYTSAFEGHDALMAFLDNPEEVFKLNPVFQKVEGGGGDAQICEYTQNTPGGSFGVCHTEQTESSCAGRSGTFSSGSCLDGDPIGYCETADGNIYYYSGSPTALEMGCGFAPGTWHNL